jgi:hypothetical protein
MSSKKASSTEHNYTGIATKVSSSNKDNLNVIFNINRREFAPLVSSRS